MKNRSNYSIVYVAAVQGDEFSELKIPYNTGTRIENSRRSEL